MGSKQIGVLKTIEGPQPKTKEIFIDKDDFSIGLSQQADLRLDVAQGGAPQAMIRRRGNAWFLQAVKETERLVLNNKLVSAAKLNGGDKIKIGNQWFLFEILTVSEGEPSKPVEDEPLHVPPNIVPVPARTAKSETPSSLFKVKTGSQFSPASVAGMIMLVAAISLIVLLSGLFVFSQWQFIRLRNAYQSEECSRFASLQGFLNILGFVPGGAGIREKVLMMQEECSLVNMINIKMAASENEAAFQGYLDYLRKFGDSPLYQGMEEQFIQFLQNTDPQTLVSEAQCTQLNNIQSVLQPYPELTHAMLSLTFACAKLYESQGNAEMAMQNYMQGFHSYPTDAATSTLMNEFSQNSIICPFLPQLERDAVFTASKDFLLKAYHTCTMYYHGINDLASAQAMFDKLIRYLEDPNWSGTVETMMQQDEPLCVYLSGTQAISPSPASEILVNLLLECARKDAQQNKFQDAYQKLDRILRDFSDTPRSVDVANFYTQVILSLSQQAVTLKPTTEPVILQMTDTVNMSRLKLMNNSPYPLRLALIGSQPLIVDLPACDGCAPSSTASGVCPVNVPTKEVEFQYGNYQIIIVQVVDNQPDQMWSLTWDFKNSRQYSWCLIP